MLGQPKGQMGQASRGGKPPAERTGQGLAGGSGKVAADEFVFGADKCLCAAGVALTGRIQAFGLPSALSQRGSKTFAGEHASRSNQQWPTGRVNPVDLFNNGAPFCRFFKEILI